MVGIEDERLILMLRYFSICFHIPLSNRDVSTYGYFTCGFTDMIRVEMVNMERNERVTMKTTYRETTK